MTRYSSLFNSKTIQKICSDVELNEKQKTAASEWLQLLEKNQLKDEQSNYPNFQQIILQDLLDYSRNQIIFEKNNMEYQIKNSDDVKIIGIEAKGTGKDIFAYQHYGKKEQEKPILQLATYMVVNNLEYGICTNYKEFVLIMKQFGLTKIYKFQFNTIKNNEEKLKEFIGIFGRERLLQKGYVEKLYKNSVEEDKDLTNEFYNIFHQTRLMMVEEFRQNPEIAKNEAIHYAQLYLNRLIFMFFAEDRGFIYNRTFTEQISAVLKPDSVIEKSQIVCQRINTLFTNLDKGSKIPEIFAFNGGLFQEQIPSKFYFYDLCDPSIFNEIKKKIKTTVKNSKLSESVEQIIKKFGDNLNPIIVNLLKMNSYDFTSQVNVDILGHIFEQSISDLEELYDETVSKRKTDGVYYTPEYITDYICRNTIIPYLSKNNSTTVYDLVKEYSNNIKELEGRIKDIKILDPACGSGAFLVKAVDILLEIDEEIQKYKPNVMEQRGIEEYNPKEEIFSIIENNIYGVDINEESVEITKLSLFLKLAGPNRQLIGLSKNIKKGNSIVDSKDVDKRAFDWRHEFPHILYDPKLKNSENELLLNQKLEDGFDIIIGNPPYGAELNEIEQEHLNKRFGIGSTDTAQLMMVMSHKLLKNNGYHGFIVPKPFIYASNWTNIRSIFLDELKILIDVGKVWKEVKLEQAVYILRKGEKPNYYWNGIRHGEYLSAQNKIEKKHYATFGFFVSGVNEAEIELGQRIFTNSKKLEKFVTNSRGAIYQKFVKETGDTVVLGGKQVQRYHTSGIYGRMNKNEIKDLKAYVQEDSILAQRMVAHILRPVDHIKITATITRNTDFIIVDTINQIRIINNSVSPYFILGLLNSKVINWYVYRFIVGRAIRTIQFDNPVTKRIPIIIKNENEVISKVKTLLEIGQKLNELQGKFLVNVRATFGLNKINEKISEFYDLESNEVFREIKELHGKTITAKENEDWLDYFKKRKDEAITLKAEFCTNESELNDLFYHVFDLTDEEIKIIESTTPE